MADEKQVSFKSRVCNTVIQYAQDYYNQYVAQDYLVISDAFHNHPYYIVSAEKSNYLHLIGVSTNLSALGFFDKCYDGTLTEADFEISAHGQDEKSSKGSIRRKIKALPSISGLIEAGNLVEESFQKNAVSCTIASSDGSCTLGFIAVPSARPKTLLIGNELDKSKAAPIKMVLSKSRTDVIFSSIQSGRLEDLVPYYGTIGSLLSTELKAQVEAIISEKDTTTSQDDVADSSKNTDTTASSEPNEPSES